MRRPAHTPTHAENESRRICPPHANNIYQAVISPDREQTQEITAEDGFILGEKDLKKKKKAMRKGSPYAAEKIGPPPLMCSGFVVPFRSFSVPYTAAPGSGTRLIT